MTIDLKNFSAENIEQLALDLVIDEIEVDAAISPAEAQRRSQNALAALKLRLKHDADRQAALSKIPKEISGKTQISSVQIPNDLCTWADDFYRLLDGGWPWRVAAYIAWASSPKQSRWPRTQEELASEILGLNSDRQIATWRKKNPAIDEMIGIMQAIPLLDHRRDIFEALIESASNPSSKGAQDRKTALSMTGDYVPRQKVEVEREKADPIDLTEEELRRMAAGGKENE